MASEDHVEKRLTETLTQTNANLHGCAETLRVEFKKAVEEAKEELRNATGAALRQSADSFGGRMSALEAAMAELAARLDSLPAVAPSDKDRRQVFAKDGDTHLPKEWSGENYSFGEFEYKLQNYVNAVAPRLRTMKLLKEVDCVATTATWRWVKDQAPTVLTDTDLGASSRATAADAAELSRVLATALITRTSGTAASVVKRKTSFCPPPGGGPPPPRVPRGGIIPPPLGGGALGPF